MHLCNQHPDQEAEHDQCPRSYSGSPVVTVPTPAPVLTLTLVAFGTYGIICYMLFYDWLLLLRCVCGIH